MEKIAAYADGSCNTRLRVGAWVAIILLAENKELLRGIEKDTTHNRMELTAAIEAIKYGQMKYGRNSEICIFSDSQYVVGLPERFARLTSNNFMSKAEKRLQIEDLVRILMRFMENGCCKFFKVKAHATKSTTTNHNIEADMVCRQMMRKSANASI